MITGLSNSSKSGEGDEAIEVDHAPLIHRARNVVKCRTSHPTMRVRVCAVAKPEEDDDFPSDVVEAFFRATLVKLSSDSPERQIAGKLILTQREGTPATKSQDQNGAIVNADGKLIASQAAPETHSYILLKQYGEIGKTTPFKYENGALCATFPEMGVTLNSMVDRRQLATRYAIQVEAAINIGNKLIVKHVREFIIFDCDNVVFFLQPEMAYLQAESSSKPEPPVPWRIIQQVLRNFVKAQYPPARSLDMDELLHLQCMLFLPRVLKCRNDEAELELLEMQFFKNIRPDNEFSGAAKILNRLRRELVVDELMVDKREFLQDKCISLTDQTTELKHSLWQWIYRATEMIMDVGHKLCPSSAIFEKKCKLGNKAKKPSTTADDSQTMLSLFNSRIITFCGIKSVLKVFKTLHANDVKNEYRTKAIMIRFCDENAAHLSLAFNNPDEFVPPGGRPLMGSLSSDQIKDFKQGLPEVLMDETFPKQYDRIVRFEFDRSDSFEKHVACMPKKKSIFQTYNTLRLQNDCTRVNDSQCVRINALTGERLEPITQNAEFSSIPNPFLPQMAHLQHGQIAQGLSFPPAFPPSTFIVPAWQLAALQHPIFLNLFNNTPTNSEGTDAETEVITTQQAAAQVADESAKRSSDEQDFRMNASSLVDMPIRPQIVVSNCRGDTAPVTVITEPAAAAASVSTITLNNNTADDQTPSGVKREGSTEQPLDLSPKRQKVSSDA
ncbi:unnamed protein product [Anisakis simplex]|uniref:Protein kinase domain-containing protein n=1 Tax=Anisakis simplex TaxID=6269 RepID=A0A0M3K318_ANISI|nr:unnamed protein product [Anisakis simplex]